MKVCASANSIAAETTHEESSRSMGSLSTSIFTLPMVIFSRTRGTSFLAKNTPPPFFSARCSHSHVRKLNSIADSRSYFIFGRSWEFRKNWVLSNFSWLMDSESYDHFCMWSEEPKRGDLLAKAFPSCKDGKIYLNCRKCQHPCLIYGSISSGWNIGQLKKQWSRQQSAQSPMLCSLKLQWRWI